MTSPIRAPHAPCYPDLKGRTALVTGGGAGIGRGVSIRLAAEGMHVCLCGRTEETLAETATLIDETGGSAVPIVADVARPDDIRMLFATMARQAPPLEVLVHNAAWVHGGNLASTTLEDWRQMMTTNLESVYSLARAAMNVMAPRRQGAMIFISTIGAQQAHHKMTAYDTSKGGVDAFVRSLALELAPAGIRVNGIAPGAIDRNAHAAEVEAAALHQPYIPMLRRGIPAEIASAVAFLAGGQASYITGQILTVDGGATAQLSPPGIFI